MGNGLRSCVDFLTEPQGITLMREYSSNIHELEIERFLHNHFVRAFNSTPCLRVAALEIATTITGLTTHKPRTVQSIAFNRTVRFAGQRMCRRQLRIPHTIPARARSGCENLRT